MEKLKQLSLLSENKLKSRAPDGFPVSCPTLDIAATWDSSNRDLLICRPRGEIVSKIHQLGAPGTTAPEAVAVTWKPDGQFLAVGWSDGVVRLMGLENNKAAHHIQVCEASAAKITHIGWAGSNIAEKSNKLGRLTDGMPDGWAMPDNDLPVDLPQELTFLEIDTALPKISPLPSSSAGAGEDATVFTLRSGIEFLFQPLKRDEYNKVNVMVVGTSDGQLHLSIYDSFVVGTFPCPVSDTPTVCQMMLHASSPDVPTHALVFAAKATEPEELHVVPMDLPFISSSPINLSLLASKLTTLQKLLRYLKQTQLHMLVEWKNARELPGRFLRSVAPDLEEMQSGPRDIVAALYHTVLTGHAHGPVREWLVDSLAERGHKRWDKAVVSGLENLRSLVHENFLPVLERCAIILSRLRGLAQFHDDRDDIGFSAMQVTRVLDIIGCLTLVGHKILSHVMDELDHFAAFSVWLRFQIDRLASSAGASAGDELTEKEATMDNAKVLGYIEKYLTTSPLGIFLDDISTEDCAADWEHCEDGPSLLEMLDKQLKRRADGQPSMRALPQVDFLVNYMTTWCSRIFNGIAESQKRSVRFGKPIKLALGLPISKSDVRVCKAEHVSHLGAQAHRTLVHIFRTEIDIVNGISANRPVTSCCIDLGDCPFIDLKFLNDETLIILCNESARNGFLTEHAPMVIFVPIKSDKLVYDPREAEKPDQVASVSAGGLSAYRLPEQPSMRPIRMQVHDRSDLRGEIPQRICLLGGDRVTWRTLSTPPDDT
ncbi:hypothetical protein HIM_04465 [Hirsutella minnesotensis 3608]|uniref:Anaphase-promoting complex subunit 4 n=1 Tax=Hirsutella minnesotensis 3608 TaxID=1043627 RepID=A0A0F8A5V9_9HYPO|nr:hypothetical protein HIM_04465 [Hirsutella minnesotensis 3608]